MEVFEAFLKARQIRSEELHRGFVWRSGGLFGGLFESFARASEYTSFTKASKELKTRSQPFARPILGFF